MSEIANAGALACLDIYDPVTPGVFDDIYHVGETTCGRVLRGNRLHLVMQGTENVPGWMSDADCVPFNHPVLGEIHSGFWQNITALTDQLEPYVNEVLKTIPNLEIEVEGHSKGAGEGIILAAELHALGYNVVKVYLFACPNAGMHYFANYAQQHLDCISYRNAPSGFEEVFGDPVPLVPILPYVPPVPHTHIEVAPPGFERCLCVEWHKGALYNQFAQTQ